MRAGSRRGVLGSVGHGAGRDHVCSQVVTERYSLRHCTRVDRSGRRNSGRYMAPAQPGLRFAASYRGRECVVRAPGPRGTAPGPVRRGPSARMTRIVIHGQTTRSSLFRGRFVTRYVHESTTERGASRVPFVIISYYSGASGVHCVHALLIDIVRREIRSVHVHGRAVDSNDDVTTARENETRSTRAGESREASLRADPGRSL